ncbi:MAG: hypothetical protein ACOVQE_09775, partial [Chitinophagaceae bacterium]
KEAVDWFLDKPGHRKSENLFKK